MTTSNEKSFFDLHITGLGYLNRIREVKPAKGKRGDTFLACDIAALNGPTDDVSYVRFDTRISGSEAQHLVRRCEEAVKAERKVLIGFRLGDLWTDVFTYTKGKNAGQQGVSLKARLLFISWIKIDGELFYKAEEKHSDAARETPASTDPETPAEKNAPEAESSSAFPDPVASSAIATAEAVALAVATMENAAQAADSSC
ncbi:STY4534 family ICE replication protein [Burkholderia gladioli]|uniref:STY4534 family ICE replication protein n=1 Tax=Burkholderia gladioli TaxID=28095 RepID=UPI00163FFD25|nr:STY4534 family ICE replication protein [Burkholderia gladioli]